MIHKIQKNKTVVVAATMTAILLGGCSSFNTIDYDSSDYKKSLSKEMKNNNSNILVEKMKKEEISVDRYIDLSFPKNLKRVLKEISHYTNRVYMMSQNSKNIQIPRCDNSKLLKINNYETLKKYIEATTKYTLIIQKNKFYKNAPKIVSAIEKNKLDRELKNISLNIQGRVNVQDVLMYIADKSGFSVVYKNMKSNNSNNIGMLMMQGGQQNQIPQINTATNNNQDKESFDFVNQKIKITTKNAEDFLSFVRDYYDVYVDVNYNTKIITISKYKTKVFTNILYHGIDIDNIDAAQVETVANKNQAAQTTATNIVNDNSPLGNKTDIVNALATISSQSQFYFDEKTGNLVVTTTYKEMKKIENYLNKLDDSYNKRLEVVLYVFELAISKEYNYGIDIGTQVSVDVGDSLASMDVATSYVTNNFLKINTELNNPVEGRVQNLSAGIQSDNNFVKLLSFNTYSEKITNNIMSSMDIATSTDYLKNVTSTTTTTTTAPVTNTTTEVGTIQEGSNIKILARMIGNKIFLKTSIKLNSLTELVEKKIGDDNNYETISLPKVDKKSIPASIMLYNGEKKIIASYTTYDRADRYNGLLPMDKFALGGVTGEQYIKKELVFVIKAREID